MFGFGGCARYQNDLVSVLLREVFSGELWTLGTRPDGGAPEAASSYVEKE